MGLYAFFHTNGYENVNLISVSRRHTSVRPGGLDIAERFAGGASKMGSRLREKFSHVNCVELHFGFLFGFADDLEFVPCHPKNIFVPLRGAHVVKAQQLDVGKLMVISDFFQSSVKGFGLKVRSRSNRAKGDNTHPGKSLQW